MKFDRVSISFLLLLVFLSFVAAQEPRVGRIEGCVVDLFGSPIEAAGVELWLIDSGQRLRTKTNADGFYKYEKVPLGAFEITAASTGFRRETVKGSIFEGVPERINFGLEAGSLSDTPPIEVSGVVRKNNLPIANAVIVLINAFNHRITSNTTTDNLGRYLINVNSLGQYVIYAYAPRSVIVANGLYLAPTLPRKKAIVDFMLLSAP